MRKLLSTPFMFLTVLLVTLTAVAGELTVVIRGGNLGEFTEWLGKGFKEFK